MQVVVASGGSDQLRDLYEWLQEEPELRGRVKMADHEAEPGTMGLPVAALEIIETSGTALTTAIVTALTGWLRSRRGEVSITLTRGDQRIVVSAKGVKRLDSAQVRALLEEMVRSPDGADAG